jgi:hypothetical protein
VPRRGGRFDRRLDPPGIGVQAEVIQHQRAAADGADRVTDTAAGDVGSGTVHGLEHAGEATLRVEVRARGQAEAARDG